MDQNIGKIQPVEITTEMQKNFLDYAMSVIVALLIAPLVIQYFGK